jgi:hypothetical protein
VVIAIGSKTFGHSVDSRVSVDMLQRIAGREAQITLEGYWGPVVIEGEGYIGCLCPHDGILMYPGTQADIDQINDPRTSSSSSGLSVPKSKRTPGTIGPNFLTQQAIPDPTIRGWTSRIRFKLIR